jgi:hypothetical protein
MNGCSSAECNQLLRIIKYEPLGNAEGLFSFVDDSLFTKHSKKSPGTIRYQITFICYISKLFAKQKVVRYTDCIHDKREPEIRVPI